MELLDRLQTRFPEHYRHGTILMIHGDNMDLMAGLGEKEIELAIVDPPYGIGIDFSRYNHINKIQREKSDWDKSVPGKQYFEDLYRITKNQIIWGGEYYSLPISNSWIAWDKRLNEKADKIYGGQCELAWASLGGHRMLRMQHAAAKNADGDDDKRIHPTQKPIKLYKWLLSRYAKPGDRILDTHGGSGSICIACHDLGFPLVWIELDKDYYTDAVKRFKTHASQQELFGFSGGQLDKDLHK